MPVEASKTTKRERQFSPKKCAPKSFRTVKRGKVSIIVCCPKGKWRKGRCSAGMRAQSIIKRRR